jgi:hypothetical protein
MRKCGRGGEGGADGIRVILKVFTVKQLGESGVGWFLIQPLSWQEFGNPCEKNHNFTCLPFSLKLG